MNTEQVKEMLDIFTGMTGEDAIQRLKFMASSQPEAFLALAKGESFYVTPYAGGDVPQFREFIVPFTSPMQTIDEHDYDEVRALARSFRQGAKVEAIKLLRSKTDLGLKDAKDAVESLATKPFDIKVVMR